jgi:hypothetical protein
VTIEREFLTGLMLNLPTITLIFTIQDQHVSDRMECDGERGYWMHTDVHNGLPATLFHRRLRTSSHEQIHYKAKKIEQHTYNTTRHHVARRYERAFSG